MNENPVDRSGRLARRFASLRAYNCAHPHAAFPAHPADRATLRRFDAGGQGVADDFAAGGVQMSVDFLPGGVPALDQPDRVGTMVATDWGRGPVYVLADDVPLRTAWLAISTQWPTTLSAVRSALNGIHPHCVRPIQL